MPAQRRSPKKISDQAFVSDTNNPYAPTADHLAVATVEEVPRLDPPQSVQYALSAEMLTAFWTHRTLTSSGDNAIQRGSPGECWRPALLPQRLCSR